MKLLTLSIFLFLCSMVYAQEIPAVMDIKSPDSVGIKLGNEIKQKIDASASMRLTTVDEDRALIYFLSFDSYPDAPNTETIFSCVWTLDLAFEEGPFFVSHYVGVCPAGKEIESAEMVVAEIIGDAQFMKNILKLK